MRESEAEMLFSEFPDVPRENRTAFDQSFLRRGAALLAKVLPLAASPMTYAREYFSAGSDVARFRQFMRFAFPEHDALLPKDGPLVEALTLTSLAGWFGILKRRLSHDRNVVALTEIPVTPRSSEVWAGRIDRLDVIDGNTKVFDGLARNQFSSAADFVKTALRLHGDARFRIVDWKFSVGDCHNRIIPVEAFGHKAPQDADTDFARTVVSHQNQVQWYLLWLGFHYDLMTGGSGKSLYHGNRFTGALIYVLPNGKLHEVPVEPGPDDLERRFIEQVAYHWDAISGKRDARVFGNAATNALRNHLVSGSHMNPEVTKDSSLPAALHNPPSPAATPAVQMHLMGTGFEQRPVRSLIASLSSFTGDGNIIEVIGKGDALRNRMHLGRLADAIKNGDIAVGGKFSWERGGFIRCPVHREKTPSMHLDFERGVFYCFGCHTTGTFARDTMPAELLAVIPAEYIGRRRVGSHGIPEIPDEIARAMATAQEILSRNFPGSMAEYYLVRERHLDPDLLRSAGAGCAVRNGRDILTAELLGAGYRMDDLVAYGFLDFSERARWHNPAVQALEAHGIPPIETQRKRPLKLGRGELTEYPFATLSGRATFPLTLPLGSRAIPAGFYGRAAYAESKVPHFCLAPGDIPKGMFNGKEVSEQLADGGVEKLYVTEAIVDALVVRSLGYGPVISIIGTGTQHLEYLIARMNPGEINIALDFDNAGVTGTERLATSLRAKGYHGEINDFAGAFAINHPEVAQLDCDDFGTWWQRYGKDHHPYHNY